MATTLALDDDLISEAQRIGHHRSKKDAVIHALRDYIKHHQQQEVTAFFGGIDIDEQYDYKARRRS